MEMEFRILYPRAEYFSIDFASATTFSLFCYEICLLTIFIVQSFYPQEKQQQKDFEF